jgi:hypothetical protein
MRISDKYKFVYVSLPKGGTRSMYWVLSEHFPPIMRISMHAAAVPKKFSYSIPWFTFTVCRNPYVRAYSQWWSCIGSQLPRHGERFARKRAHLTLAELFKKMPNAFYLPFLPRTMTFKDFVAWLTSDDRAKSAGITRRVLDTQHERLAQFRCDDVLRMEKGLEAEFNRLPFVKKPVLFPRMNTSDEKQLVRIKPAYADVFDQETADLIYEWEKPTFELRKYERDSWKDL